MLGFLFQSYGVAGCLALLLGIAAADCNRANDVIERDLAIVGGGASGVYAALRLRSLNQSFVIIEDRHKLGGHTSTYTIPDSNKTIDYGVQAYGGDPASVERFFEFYDIPLIPKKLSQVGFGKTRYVDFVTGIEPTDLTFNYDMSPLLDHVRKYPGLSYNTRLPQPIPEDLTLNFGDFIAKYGLQTIAYNIFTQSGGLGDLLSQPTVNVFKYLHSEYLEGQLPSSPGFYVTENSNNQGIYLRAEAEFDGDALVSSQIIRTQRSDDGSGVSLDVQTPCGNKKIRAQKLLIAMPPTLENMESLDLDPLELSVFSRFTASGWYVALINATGFAPGDEFVNINAASGSMYHIPDLPGLYQISPVSVENVYLLRYGTPGYLDDDNVKESMITTVERVRAAIVPNAWLPPVQILAYSSHYPFGLRVSTQDIKSGFYERLDELQGYKGTWFTGATMCSPTASHVWNFTERIIERMGFT